MALPLRWLPMWVLVLVAGTGCVKDLAIGAVADALTGGGGSFSSDDDPELVREAIPFGLKTIESLLAASPDNEKLHLAAASGFAQYAYGFLVDEAEELEGRDRVRAEELRARARKLLRRAKRYGLSGLALRHPGLPEALEKDRAAALKDLSVDDVPYLYWTAVAWAAEISMSKDDLELVAQLPQVEALMGRALQLDEAYDRGAIHEFYVAYDGGRSETIGGSVARAREHLARVEALSGGRKLGPYVTWAESVSVAAQDRREFDAMLQRVLAFDVDSAPELRLVNLLAQKRARRLQARVDDLFL